MENMQNKEWRARHEPNYGETHESHFVRLELHYSLKIRPTTVYYKKIVRKEFHLHIFSKCYGGWCFAP